MRYRSYGDSGVQLSVVGLGGSGYGKIYGEYDEEAAKAGIRYTLSWWSVQFITSKSHPLHWFSNFVCHKSIAFSALLAIIKQLHFSLS